MQRLKLLIFTCLSLLFFIQFQPVQAQGNAIWSNRQANPFANQLDVANPDLPTRYFAAQANLSELDNLLALAPSETLVSVFDSAVILPLPYPDGSFVNFRIVAAPVFEPELAVQYPQIQAYRGVRLDNPHVTTRFTRTQFGFHALILGEGNAIMVDRFPNDVTQYMSYYELDRPFDFVAEEVWGSDGESIRNNSDFLHGGVVLDDLRSSGSDLRQYSIAIATTGEYTAFYGGVTNTLAVLATYLSDLNGLYEKEAAMRFVLVGNNNLIVFTNAGSDPFVGNNLGTDIGLTTAAIDAAIGSGAYDIGHVFHLSQTLGGGFSASGLAQLGVVCSTGGVKGRGGVYYGLSSNATNIAPASSVFIHEVGHQLNAGHTFNSVTAGCNGNRMANSAWEPGSGSTLMSYSGLCGGDNLPNVSTADKFSLHAGSYNEIRAYIETQSCHTTITSNPTYLPNTAPDINDAVLTANSGVTIPMDTPFILTGSATDSDALNYRWDQLDLGNAGSPTNSTITTGPMFRTFSTGTAARTFPRMSDILSGTQTLGELLAESSRAFTFRFTALDTKAGRSMAAFTFNTTTAAGPFLVTSPNSGSDFWTPGGTATVTWNVANTNTGAVNCATVDILLSTNGGTSFGTVLANDTPNDGSQLINVPNATHLQSRVKVQCDKNSSISFFDVSDANFAINAGGSPCAPATIANGDNAALITAMNTAITANCVNPEKIINLANNGTYTFTASNNSTGGAPNALPALTNGTKIVVNGNGSTLTRSGSNTFRFFYVKSSTLTLNDLVLNNGRTVTSESDGTCFGFVCAGAVYVVDGGILNLIRSVLTNNYSDQFGGALAVFRATANVVNSRFSGNSALNAGAAINAMSNTSATYSNVTVVNSVFYGNEALLGNGGGLHAYFAAHLNVESSTIAGNFAGNLGGGITIEQYIGNFTMDNSIVWGNGAAGGSPQVHVNLNTGTSSVNESAVEGGLTGTGNINLATNPTLFTNGIRATASNTPSNNGNYSLVQNAVVINQGDNSRLPLDIFDLDGDNDTGEALPYDFNDELRIKNTTLDMGAYEFGANQLSPDVNGDGTVTPVDAVYVVNRIGTGDMTADIDADGAVDAADVQIVIDALGTTP